ncbi:MAG TPA: DUF554 domain-containing protein [Actinomycetota bacterium]|nr:DUF554 domain-containing protein [Actinomycetota bacterium]
MTGTLINVGTVVAGTAAGTLIGSRLAERVRETVLHSLGLVTLVVGMAQALTAFRPPLTRLTRGAVLIVLGSVLVGGILGEAVDIDRGLERLGAALKRRFGRGEARFTEGFVVASLVFCVGPLAILGSIQDGLNGDYQLLAVKSMLDGFTSLAFASALGWGVGFSALVILVYQGTLTLSASAVAGAFSPAMIAAMSAVGGVLILGIGLRLLDLRHVRVANLLPALVLAPASVAVLEAAA